MSTIVQESAVQDVLRKEKGNKVHAARLLGISRKALWEKRKRYGLG